MMKGNYVDVLLMIIYATLSLGFLVFIHEGGHFLAARAFGVRVSEFMIGLPGPSLGFTRGETRFGVTAVLLGGYARICGMEPGEIHPHTKDVLRFIATHGEASVNQVAQECSLPVEDVVAAFEQLEDWGSIKSPRKVNNDAVFQLAACLPSARVKKRCSKQGILIPAQRAQGEAMSFCSDSAFENFYRYELAQQYRSIPFWKRSVILVAGVAVNLLFGLLAFVVIYSILGVDVVNHATGEVVHRFLNPLQSIQAGFSFIGMAVVSVLHLFNPQTAAETVQNSASVIGIAVISKTAAEHGLVSFLSFMAMISVSLGVMNLIPIPPLDGGRFALEVVQKLMGRNLGKRIMNGVSTVGVVIFIAFFVFMFMHDIQRFVLGALQ